MENKVKTNEIPHLADRLYIKLYCERKGKTNKKIIKAAKKSWLSLSLSKKKLFYETTQNRNLLNNTHTLCKSTTYLKEKFPYRDKNKGSFENKLENDELADITLSTNCVSEDNNQNEDISREPSTVILSDSIQNSICFEDDNEETNIESDQECNKTETEPPSTLPLTSNTGNSTHLYDNKEESNSEDNQDCNQASQHQELPTNTNDIIRRLDDIVDRESDSESNQELIRRALFEPDPDEDKTKLEDLVDKESDSESNQRHNITITVSEPIPPSVKNGKELYNIIKKQDAPAFETLHRIDKAHYCAAVRNLKKEYIKKYTLYLESLSKKELFDHYVRTLY